MQKNTTPPNCITAAVNDTAYTFNFSAGVRKAFGDNAISISGIQSLNPDTYVITIVITPGKPIITGAITGAQTNSDSAATILITVASAKNITAGTYIGYAPGGTEQTSINFSVGGFFGIDYGSYSDPSDNTTIIITAITSTNVQGTFSGILPLHTAGTAGPPSATITNGTFNVPIKQESASLNYWQQPHVNHYRPLKVAPVLMLHVGKLKRLKFQ